MKFFQRLVAGIFLLALLIIPTLFTIAQENDTITISGSGVVIPVFEALATASEVTADFKINISGTTGGINALCRGETDVVATTRPLSVEEDGLCASNNIRYIELLIGHDIVAYITPAEVEFAECLTSADLDKLFAPSEAGRTINWNQLNDENPDTPLTVVIPNSSTSIYVILDRLASGDGIRADALVQNSLEDVLDVVKNTPGALGVTSLKAAEAAGDSIKILALENTGTGDCVQPSVSTVEGRSYGGATRLFIYTNAASLGKAGLKDLLTYIADDESAAVIEAAGFSPISAQAYERDRTALESGQAGRQFSQEVVTFTIPDNLIGQVTIGGGVNAQVYLQNLTSTFTRSYPGVTITSKFEGEPAGLRRLCNGELDIVTTRGPLTQEQAANCQANNIAVESLSLGSQAVVLLANANTPYLTCLTTEHLTTIWSANSRNTLTTWNQVSGTFAETKMTLFAPRSGDTTINLLMTSAAGVDLPIRDDTEVNIDPLYRAAATANVEGALTFMNWRDYQRVLLNNQANIQLVGVDSGSGCVQPSPETIVDGSYPLSRPAHLIITRAALTRAEVQSLLWFLARDENFSFLETTGFIGITFADFPALRETLQSLYTQAEEAAAAQIENPPAVEETEEPPAETTPEASAEG